MTISVHERVAPFDRYVDDDETPRRARRSTLDRLVRLLAAAMRAAGHEDVQAERSDLLDGAVASCSTCGATYRAYPGEPLPQPWSCSLHVRRERRRLARGNR